MAARRDAALIAVISIAAAVICVKLDLSEALLGWTRLHERLQLDELPALLLVVACCLVWFSARRYRAARAVIENVDRFYGVVSSLIRQLRPVGFDELGIAAALENCINDWRVRLPEAVIDFVVDSGFDD